MFFSIQCSILKSKPSLDDPIIDFYTKTPSQRTQTVLTLVETARDAIKARHQAYAIESLNRSISIEPTNPFPYFFLGFIYYEEQHYQKSTGFLSKAIDLFNPFPFWKAQTHLLLAKDWKMMGDQKLYDFHLQKAKHIDSSISE